MFRKSGSYSVEKAAKKEKSQETEKAAKKEKSQETTKTNLKRNALVKHFNEKQSPTYSKKGYDTVKNVTSKKWVDNKTFNKKKITETNHHLILITLKIMSNNLSEEIKDQIDGQNEENNHQIIKRESEKFMEIFDRVFSETEPEPANLDSIDSIVEDILIAIVKKVKTLIKQKFVSEVLLNNNGQNESSSEEEA